MRALLASALLVCASPAMADWSNPELDARNLSKSQWNAIARGDFAECDADAKIKARQASGAPPICDMTMSPALFMQCQTMRERRIASAENMYSDLLYGCMARKGWSHE